MSFIFRTFAADFEMKKGLYIVGLVVLLASCANRGVGPQGGPVDSIPPLPVHANPEQGTLNFQGNRIEVVFNEYLQLDNIANNLLMSPPQQTPPDVRARGKRLVVVFQDTLRENTTYTLDFGDAVCDYHEKVPLHNFTYYFSTGPEIDTLETTGFVYDAQTLNPLKGILVGIHEDLSDSAFTTKPFLRIAKTDSVGFFRIGNMHEGTYRLYAVNDMSRDYRLTIGESLAFNDEPIHPGDTTTLFLFSEMRQKLYLQRTLREEQHRITVLFSSAPDSLIQLRPLTDSLNYHIQPSRNLDTVTVWLLDSMSIAQDSLFFEARYRRTDSVYNLEWYTDTLRAIWRAPKLNARAREAQERKNRNRRLELKTNARRDFELYDTLRLTCTTPLDIIQKDSIHLFHKKDEDWIPVPFTLLPYDTMPMQLLFMAEFQAGESYELRIDSAALYDVYGVTHIAGSYPLQVKNLSDYSTLRIKLEPYVPNARIQLLTNRDAVILEFPAAPEGTLFEYLKPDEYYIRMYIDADGDGHWTTGGWQDQHQPEPIYYFPEKIQTKSNWDFEEVWDYLANPQTEAKPKELIKASPAKK